MKKPTLASVDDDQRAIAGIDAGKIASVSDLREILSVFFRSPVPHSLPALCQKLEQQMGSGKVREKVSLLVQMGVLRVGQHEDGLHYILPAAMHVELMLTMRPTAVPTPEDQLPKNVLQDLQSHTVTAVAAALSEKPDATEEELVQALLLNGAAQNVHVPKAIVPQAHHAPEVTEWQRSRKTNQLRLQVRQSLHLLVQWGRATVLETPEKHRFYKHVETEKDGPMNGEDVVVDAALVLPKSPSGVEEVTAELVELAVCEMLKGITMAKEKLILLLKEKFGPSVTDKFLRRTLGSLISNRVVLRRPHGHYGLPTLDEEDDEENGVPEDLLIGDSDDVVRHNVAVRLRQWMRDGGAEMIEEFAAMPEGPRTRDVRFLQYLQACHCGDAKALSAFLTERELEPYDLFVMHQEFSDFLRAEQFKSCKAPRSKDAFRKKHQFNLKQLMGLTALYPEEHPYHDMLSRLQKRKSTPPVADADVRIVKQFLKHHLKERYRSYVL